MEPITFVLGGTLIAVVSGAVGKILGNSNKVKDSLCEERRQACSTLIVEKIDNLALAFDGLKEAVNKQQIV